MSEKSENLDIFLGYVHAVDISFLSLILTRSQRARVQDEKRESKIY
jgi:hypothetical protein